MTAVAQKTVLTGCLAPIDKDGLEELIATGKANPQVIKTLKCKTVAEGNFRHANYIRNLPPYIVDEPPGLLGDDTAPNPSEASLAALGSCLAVGLHANAVHRGWIVSKLELQLEGDLNITAVWGTGDVSEKPVGFTDVRVKVDMECDGVPAERDRRADRPREEMVAGRQHLHAPGQSRSQRVGAAAATRSCTAGAEGLMGSLAVARARGRRSLCHRRRSPIEVATIARKELAPLAAAIDEGTLYPADVLRASRRGRRMGQSHSRANGAADLRCAIQSIAALGEVCGATAFMAWCQNTLVWYVANTEQSEARRQRFADSVRQRRTCSAAPAFPTR